MIISIILVTRCAPWTLLHSYPPSCNVAQWCATIRLFTSLLLLLTSSFSNTSTQLLNDTKCLVPENLISLNFPARDPATVASRVLELVTASATKTGRIMNTFCGGWWLDRIRVGGHAACSDQRERHSGGGCQVTLESSMRQGDEQKSLHILFVWCHLQLVSSRWDHLAPPFIVCIVLSPPHAISTYLHMYVSTQYLSVSTHLMA